MFIALNARSAISREVSPFGIASQSEYFIEGTEPKEVDNSYRSIWIDKNTNLPAFTNNIPPEQVDTSNLELREQIVLSDPFTKEFCLNCPWPQPTNEDGTPKEGSATYPGQTINMQTFYQKPQQQKFQLSSPPPPTPPQ